MPANHLALSFGLGGYDCQPLVVAEILRGGGVRPVLVYCMLLTARGMISGHIHNLALPAEQIATLPMQIQRLSYQLACTYSTVGLTSSSKRLLQIRTKEGCFVKVAVGNALPSLLAGSPG